MPTKLDLADSAIIGFYHGKWDRSNIIALIDALGLQKSEWLSLKNNYPTINYLTSDEITEIDNYFNVTKKI